MKKGMIRFLILACIGFALGGVWAVFEETQPKNDKDFARYIKTASPLSAEFELLRGDVTVTEKTWQGQKHLVFFGFTHCPDICPATLEKLVSALDDLKSDVPVLFITVDPERDTPEVMTKYAAATDARLVGLTGTRAQVDAAIDNYKVYAAKDVNANEADPHMYLMQHSSFIYVMDERNHLIKAVSSDDSVADMITTLEAIL